MRVNMRNERRDVSRKSYTISWENESKATQSTQVRGVDASPSGIGFYCPVPLQVGTSAYIQGDNGSPSGYCSVRHCTSRGGSGYLVGVLLDESARAAAAGTDNAAPDYYEFLQISP